MHNVKFSKVNVTFIFPILLVKLLASFTFISASESGNDDGESESKIFSQYPVIPGIDIEELIKDIGGLVKKEDRDQDDLLEQSFYTEEEIAEQFEMNPTWKSIQSSLKFHKELHMKGDFFDKIVEVEAEVMMHQNSRQALIPDIKNEVVKEFLVANDLFYKIKDMTEEEADTPGPVTQDFMDHLVALIKKAKENIDLINKHWDIYQHDVKAKMLQPLDKLEEILETVRLGKDEHLKGRPEREQRDINRQLQRATDMLKRSVDKDKDLRKMSNLFLKEERSLIRLGLNLWRDNNAERNFILYEEEDEYENLIQTPTQEDVVKYNYMENQRRRDLITRMNLFKASIPNETEPISKNTKPKEEL